MDKNYIAQRLKKYLFLISIIFVLLTSIHLIYSYIYSDAKQTAMKGWSISEAIIGNIPNLNPLRNNSEQNRYINSILYRSLLTYDPKKKKIADNLAHCDIKILRVECYLKDNIKWSDWEKITKDDIIKTFEVLKENKINSLIHPLLQSVTISTTDSSIIFENTKKDINFLQIFFQPIVSAKILDLISKKELEWNFSLAHWIYSWKYKVSNKSKDETLGITTITLKRNNDFHKNPAYIETIFLKVFPTVPDFLRNKNNINIFNDKDNLIWSSIPRLEEHTYILPQYVSVFFNTSRITQNDLRAFLSHEIERDEIIKTLGEKKFQKVINPFLADIYVKEDATTKDLANILKKEKYFPAKTLITKLEKKLLEEKKKNQKPIVIKKEVQTLSQEAKIIKDTPLKLDNPHSQVIISPSWIDKYNFVSKDDILLEWKVPTGISAVFVNEYQLKWFKAGASSFYYRASIKKGTLNIGNNQYKIYFQKAWKKELIEEINIFFDTNKEKVLKEMNSLIKKKSPQKQKITTPDSVTTNAKVSKTSNTWSLKNTPLILDIETKIQKYKKLDHQFFYNEQWEKFSLELYFISWKSDIEKTAKFIKEKLEKKWVAVQIREISAIDLRELLSKWKKNYDMILAWVNLSYFNSSIYQYFHEKHIDNWPWSTNFSNFRKLDLNIALENLNWKILPLEQIKLEQKKVIKIINENHLSKTIYTPILSNLVDKNIKWYTLERNIPEALYRFNPLIHSYVREEKAVITNNKWFLWYLKYLVDIFIKK